MCGGKGGMIGSIFSGVENMANAVQSDAESKGNAKTVRSVARVEAEKARRAGRKGASSARAAAAENGLDVDLGSAAMIQDEHLSDAEYNAAITVMDANNNASNIRRKGKMQRNSYGMKAASDFVDAGAQAMGWK